MKTNVFNTLFRSCCLLGAVMVLSSFTGPASQAPAAARGGGDAIELTAPAEGGWVDLGITYITGNTYYLEGGGTNLSIDWTKSEENLSVTLWVTPNQRSSPRDFYFTLYGTDLPGYGIECHILQEGAL